MVHAGLICQSVCELFEAFVCDLAFSNRSCEGMSLALERRWLGKIKGKFLQIYTGLKLICGVWGFLLILGEERKGRCYLAIACRMSEQ